eukprot:g21190.t1
MSDSLSSKLVAGIFLLGVGLGTTIGWQSACALYRTEEKREAVRAKVALYASLYGGFGLAAVLAMSHAFR